MRPRPLRDVGIVVVSMVLLLAVVPALISHWPRPVAGASDRRAFLAIGEQPIDFVFSYRGGNQPVEVVLDADPGGSVGFDVYTDQEWQALTAGDPAAAPGGRGVADVRTPGGLFWQGGRPGAGQYHVRVFSLAQPAAFWIAVSGAAAGELTRAANASAPATRVMMTATPTPSPTATSEPAPTDMAEAEAPDTITLLLPKPSTPATPTPAPTPGRARVGAGNFQPLGERGMEFVFQYKGDNLPMQVLVEALPAGSVAFAVYTDGQWARFVQGDLNVAPVGRGTTNPYAAGNLFWQGSSPLAGRYHVRVVRVAQPAAFWIEAAGPGAGEIIALSPPATAP